VEPLVGGLLVRRNGSRAFVSADVARQIVAEPLLSRVPGTSLAMALVSGRVVGVLELGVSTGSLLVCELDGQLVACVGLELERAGFFSRTPEGVWDGALVPDLRLDRLIGSARASEGST
jgi:hypothetical protein